MATSMVVAGLASVAAAYVAFTAGWLWLPLPLSGNDTDRTPKYGYVLECNVAHRRLLPADAAHAFAYRTLMLLVSLTALESRTLDVGRGWLFGYGGALGRLTGLRPAAYLDSSARSGSGSRSIKEKLLDVLAEQGHARNVLGDAWMLTMPSYLGFEGINPLTTYYCYDTAGRLFAVVLEVHNTFGERHVYVLDREKAERCLTSSGGSRLRWTISKDFHVSPFNNRGGDYFMTISELPHPPPTTDSEQLRDTPRPLPYVSIHLRHQVEPSDSALPTLVATLSATESQSLTARNLLRSLARQPFVLLLSLLRILYEAWVLHYVKRLDVYGRPDPKPARPAWAAAAGGSASGDQRSQGVGWQPPSWFEQYARDLVCDFLARRSDELGVRVTLVAGNPGEPDIVFSPTRDLAGASQSQREEFTIWYLSPLFFSTMVMAPSIDHALLLGYHTERMFIPSSEALFLSVFSSSTSSADEDPKHTLALAQCLRSRALPRELLGSPFTIPRTHPLDPSSSSLLRRARHVTYIAASLAEEAVARWLYTCVRARFVPGHEPWLRWQRAVETVRDTPTPTPSSSGAGAGATG